VQVSARYIPKYINNQFQKEVLSRDGFKSSFRLKPAYLLKEKERVVSSLNEVSLIRLSFIFQPPVIGVSSLLIS
jgi:hypothetical protein